MDAHRFTVEVPAGHPAFEGHFPGHAVLPGVVLLAESHLALHTWPERSGVTLDVYVCNFGADNSNKAEALLAALLAAFAPRQQQLGRLQRGDATTDHAI